MTDQEKIAILKAIEPHTEVYYKGNDFRNEDGQTIVKHGQTGLKVRNTPGVKNYMTVAFTNKNGTKIFTIKYTELTCAAILVTEKLKGSQSKTK